MITEFEQRLADVLGARLPAPFGGRVRVAPSDVPAAQPAITLGVVRAERIADRLGGAPPVVAPGAPEPRRVVALRCTVALEVRPADGEARPQQVRAVDATLNVLEDPELRAGRALGGGAPDPGFLIDRLDVTGAVTPLAPGGGGDDAELVRLELVAEGIFWPVGAEGATGTLIGEIRLRGSVVPILVELASPPEPGGEPIQVTVRAATSGIDLRAGEEPVLLPIDRLAITLRGPGGKPGAGALQGGAAGAAGVRLVQFADGEARVKYAPPAAAARDELVVALDDGGGGVGVELGRLELEVRA